VATAADGVDGVADDAADDDDTGTDNSDSVADDDAVETETTSDDTGADSGGRVADKTEMATGVDIYTWQIKQPGWVSQ